MTAWPTGGHRNAGATVAGTLVVSRYPTTLALLSPPTSGTWGGSVSISARLTAASGPLAGQPLAITIAGVTRTGTSAANGTVTVTIPLTSGAGGTTITAGFAGDDTYRPSGDSAPFTVTRAPTGLSPFTPQAAVVLAGGHSRMVTVLSATGGAPGPVPGKPVTVAFSGPAASSVLLLTDAAGSIEVPANGLAAGTYSVTATFAGDATYLASTVSGTLTVSAFTGFLSPVANTGFNARTAGAEVPVKFSLGAFRGFAIFADGLPTSVQVSCTTGARLTGAVEQPIAEYSTGLEYILGQYQIDWKTATSWTRTCRQLRVTFVDGTLRTALLAFK